ncbi:hypothetical protein CSUI_005580 [Cystoisospora suis]|uniref:Uncharacterized protein n=1 Tax=Cystoisospora suis TaxID=483139 RepID=A0A2C6KT99_9APIC|nr:hypothetical protein CSUI_005580 [Cystoisospora suis]
MRVKLTFSLLPLEGEETYQKASPVVSSLSLSSPYLCGNFGEKEEEEDILSFRPKKEEEICSSSLSPSFPSSSSFKNPTEKWLNLLYRRRRSYAYPFSFSQGSQYFQDSWYFVDIRCTYTIGHLKAQILYDLLQGSFNFFPSFPSEKKDDSSHRQQTCLVYQQENSRHARHFFSSSSPFIFLSLDGCLLPDHQPIQILENNDAITVCIYTPSPLIPFLLSSTSSSLSSSSHTNREEEEDFSERSVERRKKRNRSLEKRKKSLLLLANGGRLHPRNADEDALSSSSNSEEEEDDGKREKKKKKKLATTSPPSLTAKPVKTPAGQTTRQRLSLSSSSPSCGASHLLSRDFKKEGNLCEARQKPRKDHEESPPLSAVPPVCFSSSSSLVSSSSSSSLSSSSLHVVKRSKKDQAERRALSSSSFCMSSLQKSSPLSPSKSSLPCPKKKKKKTEEEEDKDLLSHEHKTRRKNVHLLGSVASSITHQHSKARENLLKRRGEEEGLKNKKNSEEKKKKITCRKEEGQDNERKGKKEEEEIQMMSLITSSSSAASSDASSSSSASGSEEEEEEEETTKKKKKLVSKDLDHLKKSLKKKSMSLAQGATRREVQEKKEQKRKPQPSTRHVNSSSRKKDEQGIKERMDSSSSSLSKPKGPEEKRRQTPHPMNTLSTSSSSSSGSGSSSEEEEEEGEGEEIVQGSKGTDAASHRKNEDSSRGRRREGDLPQNSFDHRNRNIPDRKQENLTRSCDTSSTSSSDSEEEEEERKMNERNRSCVKAGKGRGINLGRMPAVVAKALGKKKTSCSLQEKEMKTAISGVHTPEASSLTSPHPQPTTKRGGGDTPGVCTPHETPSLFQKTSNEESSLHDGKAHDRKNTSTSPDSSTFNKKKDDGNGYQAPYKNQEVYTSSFSSSSSSFSKNPLPTTNTKRNTSPFSSYMKTCQDTESHTPLSSSSSSPNSSSFSSSSLPSSSSSLSSSSSSPPLSSFVEWREASLESVYIGQWIVACFLSLENCMPVLTREKLLRIEDKDLHTRRLRLWEVREGSRENGFSLHASPAQGGNKKKTGKEGGKGARKEGRGKAGGGGGDEAEERNLRPRAVGRWRDWSDLTCIKATEDDLKSFEKSGGQGVHTPAMLPSLTQHQNIVDENNKKNPSSSFSFATSQMRSAPGMNPGKERCSSSSSSFSSSSGTPILRYQPRRELAKSKKEEDKEEDAADDSYDRRPKKSSVEHEENEKGFCLPEKKDEEKERSLEEKKNESKSHVSNSHMTPFSSSCSSLEASSLMHASCDSSSLHIEKKEMTFSPLASLSSSGVCTPGIKKDIEDDWETYILSDLRVKVTENESEFIAEHRASTGSFILPLPRDLVEDFKKKHLHSMREKKIDSNHDENHDENPMPSSPSSTLSSSSLYIDLEHADPCIKASAVKIVKEKLSQSRKALRRQFDFYFSSYNWLKDQHLRDLAKPCPLSLIKKIATFLIEETGDTSHSLPLGRACVEEMKKEDKKSEKDDKTNILEQDRKNGLPFLKENGASASEEKKEKEAVQEPERTGEMNEEKRQESEKEKDKGCEKEGVREEEDRTGSLIHHAHLSHRGGDTREEEKENRKEEGEKEQKEGEEGHHPRQVEEELCSTSSTSPVSKDINSSSLLSSSSSSSDMHPPDSIDNMTPMESASSSLSSSSSSINSSSSSSPLLSRSQAHSSDVSPHQETLQSSSPVSVSPSVPSISSSLPSPQSSSSPSPPAASSSSFLLSHLVGMPLHAVACFPRVEALSRDVNFIVQCLQSRKGLQNVYVLLNEEDRQYWLIRSLKAMKEDQKQENSSQRGYRDSSSSSFSSSFPYRHQQGEINGEEREAKMTGLAGRMRKDEEETNYQHLDSSTRRDGGGPRREGQGGRMRNRQEGRGRGGKSRRRWCGVAGVIGGP